LRDVIDLAAKKGLVAVNPADGLQPVRRDDVSAGKKRLPFTLDQIKQFFGSKFYADCATAPAPFAHNKEAWRFWPPLICLFLGMRPNEVAQMHVSDVKQTPAGTWFLDIVASTDEDEADLSHTTKTLKTSTSRRQIPLHPELVKIGFLQFVEIRKKAHSPDPRLFPDLKPDKYGNHATYALKRFRETYLPQAIQLTPRQTFYSFRHNCRDALRRTDAPPDALQALGAGQQGKLTSDSYGDASNPAHRSKFPTPVMLV
jgi:integrase